MSNNNRREVVYSTSHKAVIEDYPIPDMDATLGFEDLFDQSRNYTMTSKEVMFSTYQAACYVAKQGIPGDLVECGVWRGGSALLASLAVRANDNPPARRSWFARSTPKRRTWLYDTFEGMTAPTSDDVDNTGISASDYMGKYSDDDRCCYADEADVRDVFAAEGFTDDDIRVVKGNVCQTLRKTRPDPFMINKVGQRLPQPLATVSSTSSTIAPDPKQQHYET